MKIKRRYPKWVHGYEDRHGKARFYLKRAGRKGVALPGLPWSPEFMAAYEQALGSSEDRKLGARTAAPGTVAAALISYYQSPAFGEQLAKSTRGSRRAILDAFRKEHGDKRIGRMHASALQNIIDKKTPAAQRNFRKAIRGFVDYCRSQRLIDADPLGSIKLARMKKGGHHTWEEEDIERYREAHGPGTKARLALELLLQTGHARADVVRMGRQHIRAGKLSMRRQKTKVQFDIPLLPDLVAEIERHPKTDLAYLVTEYDKPFTAAGFGNKFRDWCYQANLPHCSAHGLRKASAVRHALNGATVFELMAWHGWKTIEEAQRYVDEANRIRLSESAAAKMRTESC